MTLALVARPPGPLDRAARRLAATVEGTVARALEESPTSPITAQLERCLEAAGDVMDSLEIATGEKALPRPICLLHAPPPGPVPFLVDGFLPAGEPCLLAAASGRYKTSVMLQVAGAVAGGYDVLGAYRVVTPGPVLIASEEDDMPILQNRLDAIIAGHDWDRERVLVNLHLLTFENVRLDDPRWIAHLAQVGRDLGVVLYCFDPLSKSMNGDPDLNLDATRVGQNLRTLTRNGATTLLLHHLGKPKDGRTPLDQIRGASTWVNDSRAVYGLELDGGVLSITRHKMSRLPPDDTAHEITVAVEAEPDNPATWTRARIALAHPPGSWTMTHRRELSPSERKALEGLARHADEALSWSKWGDVSGMKSSTLSLAIARLKDLGYARASEVGKRAGKPVWAYTITPEGQVSLLDSNDSNPTP